MKHDRLKQTLLEMLGEAQHEYKRDGKGGKQSFTQGTARTAGAKKASRDMRIISDELWNQVQERREKNKHESDEGKADLEKYRAEKENAK